LTEKNANCNSIKHIIELNETEDFLSKNELIAYKNKLEKYLDYGYTNKSAAENYYILRGKKKEYKKILFRENYDEYTRKSWGMPLNF
jgi:transposase